MSVFISLLFINYIVSYLYSQTSGLLTSQQGGIFGNQMGTSGGLFSGGSMGGGLGGIGGTQGQVRTYLYCISMHVLSFVFPAWWWFKTFRWFGNGDGWFGNELWYGR